MSEAITNKEQPYREDWMSDDQYECYEMLADLFLGWHHIHGKLHEWGRGIKLNCKHLGNFATTDYDGLTRAVIMAHDRMIRFEIEPSGPRMLGLVLFKRHSREGSMSERHPTIEEAIKRQRS
jgi:hypothetical protein